MRIRAVAFDWGNTLMRVAPGQGGPMATWPQVEAMPGVATALEQIAPGVVCCVASNAGVSEAGQLRTALDRIGIGDRFAHIFTAYDLAVSKPDPRFFAAILATLKVAPAECVMVGDDYQADIAGAKRAGFRTVWVTSRPLAAPPPDADAVNASLFELPATLRRLDAASGS